MHPKKGVHPNKACPNKGVHPNKGASEEKYESEKGSHKCTLRSKTKILRKIVNNKV
jgi:hypothetical protein